MPTGEAPTTSEWSAILLLTKLRLILEVLRCMFQCMCAVYPLLNHGGTAVVLLTLCYQHDVWCLTAMMLICTGTGDWYVSTCHCEESIIYLWSPTSAVDRVRIIPCKDRWGLWDYWWWLNIKWQLIHVLSCDFLFHAWQLKIMKILLARYLLLFKKYQSFMFPFWDNNWL